MKSKRSLRKFKTSFGAFKFLESEIKRFKNLLVKDKNDLNAIEQLEEIKRWLRYLKRQII